MTINKYTQLKDLAAAEGRTIRRILTSYDSDALILFTDDSYLYVKADMEPWDDNPSLEWTATFDAWEFSSAALIEAGIVTAEDVEAERLKLQQAALQEQADRERQEYDRLRQKFGGETKGQE